MDIEAQKRKERLAAIRKRKLQSEGQTDRSTSDAEKGIKFRSYIPNDEKLKEHVEISTSDDIQETIESETKDMTKETLAQAIEKQKEEVDLFNLAPKKPNWDLKRDVEKKLEKLERQTQKSIYEIIRKRLQNDQNVNLAQVVSHAEDQQISNEKEEEE
ncbi:MAG: mRNA splicing factor [Benjaminiella poitrasii]|nr:MAG: mRNA splicing factor [Benjaminiella poitrasii]